MKPITRPITPSIALTLVAALMLATVAGCGGAGSDVHSTGECTGTLFGDDISGPIKPSSEFHRLDFDGGDEGAAVRMVYDGATELTITAELADMPEAAHEGVHALPAVDENGELVLWWSINGTPGLATGTVTFHEASRSTLRGEADMSFDQNGSAVCHFDLDRDSSKDTDD